MEQDKRQRCQELAEWLKAHNGTEYARNLLEYIGIERDFCRDQIEMEDNPVTRGKSLAYKDLRKKLS